MCDGAGRNLDMWVVCYEDKLDNIENIGAYLNEFDVITFWTWKGSALHKAEANFDRIRKLAPDKRVMAGCYMWNYGEHKPLTAEEMREQVELYYRLLKEKKIDGIIVCSNCIADLNIENVAYMRDFINAHADDEI
jgi:hypothetical protein